ncbi:flagellar hook-length control protein FliK [Legionella nagasakiensis]|uniref:flagellar hook-length control protein FliK n=1 Tax=Legionella nagasakiensis TaxID=535290 RepID=UPI0010568031|nr:flagellar hook-length control protein FliK [Legionella nagasakiensis]
MKIQSGTTESGAMLDALGVGEVDSENAWLQSPDLFLKNFIEIRSEVKSPQSIADGKDAMAESLKSEENNLEGSMFPPLVDLLYCLHFTMMIDNNDASNRMVSAPALAYKEQNNMSHSSRLTVGGNEQTASFHRTFQASDNVLHSEQKGSLKSQLALNEFDERSMPIASEKTVVPLDLPKSIREKSDLSLDMPGDKSIDISLDKTRIKVLNANESSIKEDLKVAGHASQSHPVNKDQVNTKEQLSLESASSAKMNAIYERTNIIEQTKEASITSRNLLKEQDVVDVSMQNKPVETTLTHLTEFMNRQSAQMQTQGDKPIVSRLPFGTHLSFQLDGLENGHHGSGIKTTYNLQQYSAKINVYPEDLGLITANIQMHGGKAELVLSADNSHVRAFLEANLHQLRETFHDSNIHLAEASVQQQFSQEKHAFNQHNPSPYDALPSEKNRQTMDSSKVKINKNQKPTSVIDTYA